MNAALVKNSNGGWRICVNFTNLNKTCRKYSYPLPNINHLVDNMSIFRMLRFGDTFIGYNYLKMHLNNEEKISFITNEGVYFYKVMLSD